MSESWTKERHAAAQALVACAHGANPVVRELKAALNEIERLRTGPDDAEVAAAAHALEHYVPDLGAVAFCPGDRKKLARVALRAARGIAKTSRIRRRRREQG